MLAPGEPGDHIGTSVTSPAPKFLLGGSDLKHLYHNSTLALDADTGEIRWYCQHLHDWNTSPSPTPRIRASWGANRISKLAADLGRNIKFMRNYHHYKVVVRHSILVQRPRVHGPKRNIPARAVRPLTA